MRLLFLAALLLLTPFHVKAEEYKEQPEFCEFSITFPEKPYERERCDPDNVNKCRIEKSYTEIFDDLATVNFRTHCEKSSTAAFQSYTQPVTKTILQAMAKRNNAHEINTSFREEEELYKQAGIVAEGVSGKHGMIYLGQIWVGQRSTMFVEAELIGNAHDTADTLFSNILRTVTYDANDKSEAQTSP